MLATLAILAWHFYQVFFDPDIYPMNWAWYDGKMSVEHYREEHGLDSKSLLEASRAQRAIAESKGNEAEVSAQSGAKEAVAAEKDAVASEESHEEVAHRR